MRHHKSGRKLNRNSSHRHAMFRNMAVSLFRHETIRTTLPKAKELRRIAEPLITLAKEASVANRRLAFSRLRDRAVVVKLFDDLGVRFKERPGGYLRILKYGHRAGDNATMALVQLVERATVGAEAAETKTKAKPKKTKAAASSETEAAGAEEVAAEPKPAKKKTATKKAGTTKKAASAIKKTTSKKTAAKKTTAKKATKKSTKKDA